jgi:hypothetical protein
VKSLPNQTRRNLVLALAARNKQYVEDYLKTHPCVDCGETDIIVLDFDHVRGTKRKDVSFMAASGYSLKAIQEEINKCDVVCSNDHRRRTAKRNAWRRAA